MTLSAIPINGETWLICGGRDFTDNDMFCSAMSDIIGAYGMPSHIVQGGAKGADYLAKQWAKWHAIRMSEEKADWNKHGKAAGPVRNQSMLDKYAPQKVIAFPGGRGTDDMKTRTRDADIWLCEIETKTAP